VVDDGAFDADDRAFAVDERTIQREGRAIEPLKSTGVVSPGAGVGESCAMHAERCASAGEVSLSLARTCAIVALGGRTSADRCAIAPSKSPDHVRNLATSGQTWSRSGMGSKLVVACTALSLMSLTHCGALPLTGLAKAQQTAQQFNLDARFGRNEYVLDQVDPTTRQEYTTHHRAWGQSIRVADVEMGTMRSKEGDKDVEVMVHVTWYRPEQLELRSTTIKQTWHSKGVDSWQLLTEARADGDYGLLGEQVVFAPSTTPREPAQFPTIRLGGGESASE
jgi:hypothetical protein